MTCDRVQHELVALIKGELPDGDGRAVRDHVAGCPACAEEEAALRDLFADFREATAIDPSPGFRDRVMTAVRAESRPSSNRVAMPGHLAWNFLVHRVRQAPFFVAAVAAHAAVILILAGIYLPARFAIEHEPQITAVPRPTDDLGDDVESKTGEVLPNPYDGPTDPTIDGVPFPFQPEFPVPNWPQDPPKPGLQPVRPPVPRWNPSEFGKPLRSGPTRAQVLGWYGGRLDGEKKAEALQEFGGDPEVLHKALAWLAERQRPDGRFDVSSSGGADHFVTGISALALLAFLGDGNCLDHGLYGAQVNRGIAYLLESQDPQTGRFGPDEGNYMYNHGIALLAVAEALSMAHVERPSDRPDLTPLKSSVKMGVDFLLENQARRGGWGYSSRDRESDTSVSAWPMAAFATILRHRLIPPSRLADVETALQRAARWFRYATDLSGGVGYRKPGVYKNGPHALTAVSLYCRGLCTSAVTPDWQGIYAKQVRMVASRLTGTTPTVDYYFMYYGAYGLRHGAPSSKSKAFLNQTQARLKSLQRSDGSFPSARSAYGDYGGKVYTTAMAALILEAPFRYPTR